MSASANYSKTMMVGLQYNSACQLFALTSADLPGLLLAGKDPEKLWADVPAVVKAIYRLGYHMDVDVVMEQRRPDEDRPFVPLQPITLLKVEPRAS
jgi:hypothetical protein